MKRNHRSVIALAVVLAVGLSLRLQSTLAAADGMQQSESSDVGPRPDHLPSSNDVYVIQTVRGQRLADVERAAKAVLGQDATVEPLFPDVVPQDDPEGLALIYRVVTTQTTPDPDQWDRAYAIKEAGGFDQVQPDTDTAIEDAQRRQAAAACMGADGLPIPDDRAWSLKQMHVQEARNLPLPPGGRALGEGIRICHPDSGWTEHDDLDAGQLDTQASLNLIGGGSDARDPMDYSGNPGHGTATGSVIISSGDFDGAGQATAPGSINGLAPKATLVPIRALKRVVQVFDSDIARAVRHASTTAKCDVISMSLGGKGFFGLERAIKDAVKRDVIVVSAAGNCVGMVVAPASYQNVIAAAATNVKRSPWNGTSQGRAVDISAPGEDVFVARPKVGKNHVEAGSGTSFATAAVAGAAATWLAYHGESSIKAAQGAGTRQALFMQALATSAQPGVDWDSDLMGPGILDLKKLLQQPLPSGAGMLTAPPQFDAITLLQEQFDLDREYLERGLRMMLRSPSDFHRKLEQFGPEIIDLATRDPDGFLEAIAPPPPTAAADSTAFVRSHGSATLNRAIR